MTDHELRRALLASSAPDEPEAQERTWATVRRAFDEREPVARAVGHVRPLLAFAVAAALVAAALTPPGRAIVGDVRDAIGRERSVGLRRAQPALFSLPTPARALVESRRGTWIVRPDGSRRLLRGYRDAAWSPHGLFVAAVRGNEVAALDEKGNVRWSLARPGLVGSPSWTGTRTDTRIAYLAGPAARRELRVVAGDGTGDRLLARSVAPVAAAWRPGSTRELAFVLRAGRLVVIDADTGAVRWRAPAVPKSSRLDWSADGRRLLVADDRRLRVYSAAGRLLRSFPAPRGFFVVDGAFAPDGRVAYTIVNPARNESRILVAAARLPRQLFAGPGSFTSVGWAPGGRLLAFSWPEADQWVFLSTTGRARIPAVSNVSRQFGSSARITHWCCAPQ